MIDSPAKHFEQIAHEIDIIRESMRIRPLGPRLFVHELPTEELAQKTASGLLWLPDQALDHQRHLGWIIWSRGQLVGDDALQPGLRVLVHHFRHQPVNLRTPEGYPLHVVWEDDILAILNL